MKRTRFAGDSCPVARAVDVVGDWWSLLIVRNALTGDRRFGAFERNLGVAKNILTDRLRKLVAPADCHPGDFGCETFNVLGFLQEKALGNQ